MPEKERKPGSQPAQDKDENWVRIELPSQWRELVGTPLCSTDHPDHLLREHISSAGQDRLRPRRGRESSDKPLRAETGSREEKQREKERVLNLIVTEL